MMNDAVAKRMLGMFAGQLRDGSFDGYIRLHVNYESAMYQRARSMYQSIGLGELPPPPPTEERIAELRMMIAAAADKSIPTWWVKHYSQLDDPETAAEYADVDPGHWAEIRGEWAAKARSKGIDGDRDDLIRAYCRANFGAEPEEFKRRVLEWDGERKIDETHKVAFGLVQAAEQAFYECEAFFRMFCDAAGDDHPALTPEPE